jgi:hypothetical protein
MDVPLPRSLQIVAVLDFLVALVFGSSTVWGTLAVPGTIAEALVPLLDALLGALFLTAAWGLRQGSRWARPWQFIAAFALTVGWPLHATGFAQVLGPVAFLVALAMVALMLTKGANEWFRVAEVRQKPGPVV